jgi:hypothetical protein
LFFAVILSEAKDPVFAAAAAVALALALAFLSVIPAGNLLLSLPLLPGRSGLQP